MTYDDDRDRDRFDRDDRQEPSGGPQLHLPLDGLDAVRGPASRRHVHIAIAAACLFLVVAALKPWWWVAAARPAAAASGAARPLRAAASSAAGTPRAAAPPSICSSPTGWRFVADEHVAAEKTRTWLVTGAAGGAAGPADRSIPIARYVTAGVDELGFCAPEAARGGWTGTLWRLEPGGAPAAATVAAQFRVPAGTLGAVLPSTTPSASWPAGTYILAAILADGRAAWLGVELVPPDRAP